MKQGEHAALTKATMEFLAELGGNSKDSKRMSDVLTAFYRCAGGPDRFGEMMWSEFQKVNGVGLSEEELLKYDRKPKIILQWYELLARHTHKEDEARNLDISSTSQEDLKDALRALAVDLAETNPDFRRIAIESAIKADPTLVNLALEAAGMEPPVEAESVSQVEFPEAKEGDESFVEDDA